MPTYEEIRTRADEVWRAVDQPQKPLVKVGVATCSRTVGAEETLEALRNAVADGRMDADVMATGCLGLCYAEPLVQVQHPGRPPVLYQLLTADKVPELIDNLVKGGEIVSEHALAVLGDEAIDGTPPVTSLEFMGPQVRRLMANCGVIDPENVDH
jgi:NADH-quinone oxidoreductase subunit F